mmetsp:Transcript_28698/g.60592  ORF Transcript_28698/g.60592 Transcript_28698/m.60592 type:complete len:961 (+) Transcript_28698:101-2983(+)
MGAKSKSKSKSKKGPKGRKARAKAKLEQVWGENVDEDARKASRMRMGKSRFQKDSKTTAEAVDPLSIKRRGVESSFDTFLKRKEEVETKFQYDGSSRGQLQRRRQHGNYRRGGSGSNSEESSSDDDESEDDEMNGLNNGGSFATLLKRISGPNKKSSSRMAVDSDDDDSDTDSDDETESDSQASSSEESEDSDADNMENASDEGDQTGLENQLETKIPSAEDPYEAHFSKPSLPQLESLQSTQVQVVPLTGNNRKVSTTSLLNSSVDVQMSGPLLDAWDKIVTDVSSGGAIQNGKSPNKKKKQSNIQTKRAWESFASGPYQHVRQVLTRNWKTVNKSALKRRTSAGGGGEEGAESDNGIVGGKVFSSLQLAMYPAVARYADVLISSETRQNRDEINHLLSLHILNHVLTSRTRVQRHNRRIKELANLDENSPNGNKQLDDEERDNDDKWRDQGYTRPKVLVLLPTRGTCWNFIKDMIRLLGDAAIVDNGERFDEEYGPLESGGSDDDEEEEEDEEDANDIKLHDGDALVVVAKTEEDFASLEVNVFDTEGSNLYVHHDIPLPGFPLCLALGSVAPSYQSSFEDSNGGDDEGSSNNAKVGNYVAVGSFEPGIEIWNLDVMNALEPTLVLGGMDTSGAEEDWMRMQNMPTSTNLNSNSNGGGGGKKKKKKKKAASRGKPGLREGSHTDAVMGLSWNTVHPQVLASGSADGTVKLWDVTSNASDYVRPSSTLTHHTDKVQSLAWHPTEGTLLATGGYDRKVCLVDARSPSNVKKAKLLADCEAIVWDPHNPQYLTAASEDGVVQCWDVRNFGGDPVWSMVAHEYGGVSDICYNSKVPGMLISCSIDKTVALWDTSAQNQPQPCGSKDMNVGKLYSVSIYPSSPWLLSCGGSGNELAIWDMEHEDAIRNRFAGRIGESIVAPEGEEPDFEAAMATGDDVATALESMNKSKKKKGKKKNKAHKRK